MHQNRIALLGIFLVCGDQSPAADSMDLSLKLVQVTKIWDQAPHNAFTDLIRFQDRWYCVFREGTGHKTGAGKIRVLVSENGEKWESAALLETKDVDLRDPKLSQMPDGRLMLLGGAAVPASRDPLTDHYSFVSFSKNGKDWTQPQRVLDSWQWLWRVTWHKDAVYGVAKWVPPSRENLAALYKSKDGLKYEKVADLKLRYLSEATLVFDGDVLYCLERRSKGSPDTAVLGRSEPPYTNWTWKDLGVTIGGPNLLRFSDGTWLAASRLRQQDQSRTVLFQLDPKAGALRPVLTLPSGGDNSYPGLVWHDNQLWVSYYSSHKDKASIYLARLQRVAP